MLEIFIDKQEKQEKVALVENGNLVEYYEEDENTDRKEGNIYVGTVKDIIPGMQSAFVDIVPKSRYRNREKWFYSFKRYFTKNR